MPATQHRPAVLVAAAVAGALVASSLGTPARTEVIPAYDTLYGTEVGAEKCAATPRTLWITVYLRSFCIRYFISASGGKGLVPAVWLSGDKPVAEELHPNIRWSAAQSTQSASQRRAREAAQARRHARAAREKARDVDTRSLVRLAARLSRETGTTAIYLARMGADGSSGHHGLRRTMLELHVMNTALDMLKKQFGFAGFHIVGQSGGATLVGGLLAQRKDLGCAVSGSGRLALLVRARQVNDPALRRFDPIRMIPDILRNDTPQRRILVITNSEDKVVHRKHQNMFVDQFIEAGGQIEQYYVQSTNEEKRHGVTPYSIFVTGLCAQGRSYEQISAELVDYVAERLAKAKDASRKRNP